MNREALFGIEIAGAVGLLALSVHQLRSGFDETGVVFLLVFLCVTAAAHWLREV